MKRFLLLLCTLFVVLTTHAWAVPAAPVMNVTAEGIHVTLNWAAVPGATGYKLYYAPYPYTGPESIGSIDVGNQTGRSFYLWPGAAYHVAVTAYDSLSESGYSNIERFIMGPPTPEWLDSDGDGFTGVDGDCDDANPGAYPGAVEICGDGIDQSCNGIDQACPDALASPMLTKTVNGLAVALSWTPVTGAAGYRLYYSPLPFASSEVINSFDFASQTHASFNLSIGAEYYVAVKAYTDSGESDFSNIEHIVIVQTDPNDMDEDGDGYSVNQGDCDDENPAVHPGAFDVCEDGIDQDCSGSDRVCASTETDQDGDGFSAEQGDCDDGNPLIFPGAMEICGDGIDQDCSGSDQACREDLDLDGDGYTPNQGDCNDADSRINPGANELCGDGIDQNCSGQDELCAQTASAPLFSLEEGSFPYGQLVTMTTATPEAEIRYTTDGAMPTLSSRRYTSPVAVNVSQTLKALAYRSGMNPSPVTAATYTINRSLTGDWTVSHTTGINTCGQTVGDVIQFDAEVEHTGNIVTVVTQAGSGSGTLNGNQGSWTITQPVNYDTINGVLTFSMDVRVSDDWKSFSGPTRFSFSDGSLSCSGVGSISGTRVL